MLKFIIGVDAFSDPNTLEDEFITHTQFPKFIGEIIFAESGDHVGFKLDSIKLLWNEDCSKDELSTALREARVAIQFYTEKSMSLDDDDE